MTRIQVHHKLSGLALTALFLFTTASCGGDDSGAGTDNPNSDNANNDTSTPAVLSSIDTGEAIFKFSGDVKTTLRFKTDYSPGSGFHIYKGEGGEELETLSSAISHRTESDQFLSMSLHGIKTGEGSLEDEYAPVGTGAYTIVNPETPLSKLKQMQTFASFDMEDFLENSPIWTDVTGDVDIQEIDNEYQTATLVGTMNATLKDDGVTVKVKAAFKARRESEE